MVLCRYCHVRMDYSFYNLGLYVLFVCPKCGHSCTRFALPVVFGVDDDKIDLSKIDDKGVVVGSGVRVRRERFKT